MEAFDEGVKSYNAGCDLNPYDESDTKHDEWDDGWFTTNQKFHEKSTKE